MPYWDNPFGDFLQVNDLQTDEQYKEHIHNEEWFETFGELAEGDKSAFVDWWFEHYRDDDFPYSWEDFREKYGAE